MGWEINKAFEFCYGHTVHNQFLEEEYSLTTKCKCRHLHGHQGKIVVNISGQNLKRGMVTDFNNLNWVKDFIDSVIDHRFIIDWKDPNRKIMGIPDNLMKRNLIYSREKKYSTLVQIPEAKKDYFGSFVFVNFVPTSENLSKWIYEIIEAEMGVYFQNIGAKLESVEWWETPKSKSIYRGSYE